MNYKQQKHWKWSIELSTKWNFPISFFIEYITCKPKHTHKDTYSEALIPLEEKKDFGFSNFYNSNQRISQKSNKNTIENRSIPNYSKELKLNSIKESQTFPHAKLKLFLYSTTNTIKTRTATFVPFFSCFCHPSHQATEPKQGQKIWK